jgi:hypothetical protein
MNPRDPDLVDELPVVPETPESGLEVERLEWAEFAASCARDDFSDHAS